jgi:arylsulfatase A-like enzyme
VIASARRRRIGAWALAMLLVGVAASTGSPGPGTARAAARRPNILIIVTDDQTTGTVLPAVMPNTVREFVRRGRRYPNFFVTDPLCCPSRASIMTGRFDHNNGVTDNSAAGFHLDMSTTLQHYLHEAGYRTWISGKFLNGWPVRPGSPNPPDWDRFLITQGGRHLDLPFNQDGRFFRYAPYAEPLIERQASRYLAGTERHDAQPWFGYLSFTVPHGPYTPMRGYRRLPFHVRAPSPAEQERNISDKWPGYAAHAQYGFDSADWLEQLRMLHQADDIIGDIFSQLRSQRELRNTIVVFLSDNGFLFRSHQLLGKRLPYTEAVRVPAMIRWPGHIRAGSVDRRFSTNVDLAPTLLKAAGVTPDPLVAPFDGRNLLGRRWTRRYVLLEHWASPPPHKPQAWAPTWGSLRSARWQYIEYDDAAGNVTFREYYDLVHDRWMLRNRLAGRSPPSATRLARLHALLAAARSCAGPTCP